MADYVFSDLCLCEFFFHISEFFGDAYGFSEETCKALFDIVGVSFFIAITKKWFFVILSSIKLNSELKKLTYSNERSLRSPL